MKKSRILVPRSAFSKIKQHTGAIQNSKNQSELELQTEEPVLPQKKPAVVNIQKKKESAPFSPVERYSLSTDSGGSLIANYRQVKGLGADRW